MVNSIGATPYASLPTYPTPGSSDVAALQGRVQQARAQLNDWATCVSAQTPKGQAEIQKFSGEISADKQKIARAQQSANNSFSTPQSSVKFEPGDVEGHRGVLVDVWA
jgi:hypothetical protein